MNPSRVPAHIHASVRAAQLLQAELGHLHIKSDLHYGYGIALLSIWLELVIWSDGFRFLWWGGGIAKATERRRYVVHSVSDPAATARRIALRYAELRENPPASALTAETTS